MRTMVLSLTAIICLSVSQNASAQSPAVQKQIDCIAMALYWEARGESERGMIAVGWAILNRANSPDFPATPCEVVHQGGEKPPCQFSWWCDGKSDRPTDLSSWTRVRTLATRLVRDPPRDPTRGAVFFHSTAISEPWRRKRTRTARVGNHVFYR